MKREAILPGCLKQGTRRARQGATVKAPKKVAAQLEVPKGSNAERIAACLDACKGIPTEALKDFAHRYNRGDAMKPHEETWVTDEDNPGGIRLPGYGKIAAFYWTSKGPSSGDRAKLAAQAPAMAKFIVYLRRAGILGEHDLVDDGDEILRAAGVLPPDALP